MTKGIYRCPICDHLVNIGEYCECEESSIKRETAFDNLERDLEEDRKFVDNRNRKWNKDFV